MAEMQAHIAADELVKGTYKTRDGKGCFIGCAVNKHMKWDEDWHEAFERIYGIDIRLTYLFGSIFEDLPAPDHRQWALHIYEAISPGADLSLVADKFLYWLLQHLETLMKGR